MPVTLLHDLQAAASALDFDLAGVVPANAESLAELSKFSSWIESGYGGEMQYLKAKNEAGAYKRESLRHALPWAQSAIVGAINYNTAPRYSMEQPKIQDGSARGWISRYAWSAISPAESGDPQAAGDHTPMHATDYHETVLARLRKLEAWLVENAPAHGITEAIQSRCYVDTGPVIERVHAKYAGLGWIAKNTCLINQKLGSWIYLCVLVTSLPAHIFLETGMPSMPAPDRCGTCTRCLDACPTQAFIAPYRMDASRCIAYLTIEKRGSIPEELREGIGRNVFGCDICQDVCPWNHKAPVTALPEFQPRPGLVNPELQKLGRMTHEEFRGTFRGSPVERTKYSGFRRNVAIAMGNSEDPSLLPLLEEMASGEDSTVAEHARWAIEKLKQCAGTAKT